MAQRWVRGEVIEHGLCCPAMALRRPMTIVREMRIFTTTAVSTVKGVKIDHRNIPRLCQSLQPVKSQTRTVSVFHRFRSRELRD